jgi:hypothetical protein
MFTECSLNVLEQAYIGKHKANNPNWARAQAWAKLSGQNNNR